MFKSVHSRRLPGRGAGRIALIALALVTLPSLAAAATLTLAWDPINDPSVDGYVVYVTAQPTGVTESFDAGAATMYAFSQAVPGVTYHFAVAGYADGIVGDRSVTIAGTAAAPPAAPTALTPTGSVSATPAFSWTPVAGATSYLLWANDVTQQGRIQTAYSPAQAGCSAAGTTCRVVAPVPLAAGAASWSVRAANSAGDGPWSATLGFTVTASSPTLVVVPRADLSVHFVDSQETAAENGAAVNAIDGSTTTHWHTKWQGTGSAMPHEIQIKLARLYPVSGVRYLPRQDGSSNGRIARYEVYVSIDGVNWGAPVATGTMPNVAAMQQVVFTPKTGQYVRVRALSEVLGRPYTAIAELNVLATSLETPYYLLPSTGWTLRSVDSQETVRENGRATNAFDNNPSTYWHTQWSPSVTPMPHDLQIALGQSYAIGGFRYLPRQDGSVNGRIGRYEFYVSADGVTWGTPVATGTFLNDGREKEVVFAAKAGRYIRLRALSEATGASYTSVAELKVLAQR